MRRQMISMNDGKFCGIHVGGDRVGLNMEGIADPFRLQRYRVVGSALRIMGYNNDHDEDII